MKEKIEQAFNLVRESEELGRGSCSTVDECFSDEELIEDIEEYFEDTPFETAQDYFKFSLRVENIRSERENEYF